MSLHRRIASVIMVVLVCAPAGAQTPTPSPGSAPYEVGGEPAHGARVRPIPVLEGHSYAVPRLVEGLDAADPVLRSRCCFLLGEIGDQQAVVPLVAVLDDPARPVRQFAGIALCRLGDERGLQAAASAQIGPRWWIRFHAATALGVLGSEAALRALSPALIDPDELVRAAAETARSHPGPVPPRGVKYLGPSEAELGDIIYGLANYLIGEGEWWWHAGDYPQILRTIETAVWVDPGWAEGLPMAGYLYWSLGRDTEAISAYRRAVHLHPDSWITNWELGFYYFNAMERYEDAVEPFARARALGCPHAFARMHAHALEHCGRPEESLAVWRELQQDRPDDPVVRMNIRRLEASAGG